MGKNVTLPGLLILLAALIGCGDEPSYKQLKEQNEELIEEDAALKAKLLAANQAVDVARSELRNLESQIETCEGEQCNAISVSDVESKLDEIEAETE